MEAEDQADRLKRVEALIRLDAIESKIQTLESKIASYPPVVGAGGSMRPTTAGAERTSSAMIDGIDGHISTSDIFEAQVWISLRREVIRQDAIEKEREHQHFKEKFQLYAKLALSIVALGTGAGLAFGGFDLPAFVCLGAGLHSLAPDLVEKIAGRVLGRGTDKHE